MPFAILSENRNFLGLLAANTILGAAMPMLIILSGLAGVLLAPTAGLATLPLSLQTLAGLFAAGPFSLLMGKLGRRPGFVIGGLFSVAGAALATYALISRDFVALCAAHMIFGAAQSCYQYFRFAAAEVVSRSWQPVAISLMLTSGLVAALVGPQVFIMMRDAMMPVPLVGAYVALGAMTLIGLLPLGFVKMPRPAVPNGPKKRFWEALHVLRDAPIRRAILIGALSQGAMVFLMVPTPVAMIGCGLSEDTAGDVIRWHVVAMFAPSFFTGFLIKRFGTRWIVLIGLVLLAVSAAIAATGLAAVYFYVSLIVLGVGWNFGFIGATTMLASVVTEEDKAMVQGVNDTVIALNSTIWAFAAGAVIAGWGWTVLAIGACVILTLTLVPLLFTRWDAARA